MPGFNQLSNCLFLPAPSPAAVVGNWHFVCVGWSPAELLVIVSVDGNSGCESSSRRVGAAYAVVLPPERFTTSPFSLMLPMQTQGMSAARAQVVCAVQLVLPDQDFE